MRVRIGRLIAAADGALLELARTRCALDAWRVASGEPALRLSRVAADEPGPPCLLNPEAPELGAFWVEGERLRVRIPEDAYAAEAALRVLFQLAHLRQGALLLHASGFALGASGVLATGPSGAGKSTLARLCRDSGAVLLSDETVAVYPGGDLHGTPFSSEPDLRGSPARAPLAALLVLEKGGAERLSPPLPPAEAVALLLSQAYPPDPRLLPRAELLGRAAALARAPGVRRLTFRKDAAVGPFLRGWLERGDAG